MRRLHARLAAACALAVAIAVFAAGAAFAGGGHGNGNGNGNGYGHDNGQQSQQPSQQQGYPSGGAQSDHHSTDGQTQQTQQTQQSQQPQQQAQEQGVKPSNSTHHWTHTTVGANPDVSKRYGNGKTAAQIAASRGAPASQPLTGPGNSQPHKTYDCRHKNNRSGGVDVHAIKSYSASDCGAATQEQQTTTTTPQEQVVYVSYCQHEGNRWVYKTTTTEQLAKIVQSEDVIAPSFSYHGHSYSKHWDSEGQTIFNHCKHSGSFTEAQTTTATPAPAEQHVTICHATGTPDNAGNGYVMISPSASGVYHGHYREHGADIIPPFTYNGQTFSLNWTTTGQAIFNNGCRPVGAVAGTTTSVTTTTPCTCTQSTTTTTTQATTATTTTQATTTTTTQAATTTTTPTTTTTTGGVAGTTTTATTTTTAAATTVPQVTRAAAAPVGGVLGAQTSLTHKPASHGGVLGTVTHVAGSSLPFTGFPVWLAVLIALALILAGFALRRRTLGTRGL